MTLSIRELEELQMENKVVRTKEAAKYLAISPWKLRNLAHEGRVAYISDGDARRQSAEV